MNPVRTCLGCRNRNDKAQLIRLVARDGTIVVDPRQTFPGRGAYLHRQPECWTNALRKRVLTRKLPVVEVDTERLLADLATVTDQVI